MENDPSNDEENTSMNGELGRVVCRVHKELCNYYCNVCGFPICSKCISCLNNHEILSIDYCILKRKNELLDMSPKELLSFFEYIENRAKVVKTRINILVSELSFIEAKINTLEQNKIARKNKFNKSKDKLREIKQMILDISGAGDSSMTEKLASAVSILNKASEENDFTDEMDKDIEELEEEKKHLYEQYQRYLGMDETYAYIKTFDKTNMDSMTDGQLTALAMVKYVPYNIEDKISNIEDFEAFKGVSELSHFRILKTLSEDCSENIPVESGGSGVLEFKELILDVKISSFEPLNLPESQTGKISNVRTVISPSGVLYYICFETDDIYTINLNSLERNVISNTDCHKFVAIYHQNIYIFGYKNEYMISMEESELLKKYVLCQSNKISCSNVKNYIFSSDLTNVSGKVYYCNEKNRLCCFDLEKGNEEIIREWKTFGIVNTLSVQFQNIERIVYDASKTVCILKDDLKQSVILRSKLIPQYIISLKNNRIQDSLLISVNGDVMWKGKIVFGQDSCAPKFGFSLCRLYKSVFILYDEDRNQWGCVALKCT